MPRLTSVVAALLLAACLPVLPARGQKAVGKPGPGKGKVHALTEKNSGKTIKLTKGDTITVTLDSNPTTGYRWSVVRINPELIALQGKQAYKAYPAAAGIVGSGGQAVFTFKAVEAGRSEMEIVYQRPFAPEEGSAGKFTVKIEVKE